MYTGWFYNLESTILQHHFRDFFVVDFRGFLLWHPVLPIFIMYSSIIPYALFFNLQFENGLREIGPRKDRNAAPLRDGKTNSFFQAYLADVGNCGFPPSNYCLVY